MLNLAVMVSGGGTNLQAIIDQIENGSLPGVRIADVISNNKNAGALERARRHKIKAECICPKDFPSRQDFNEALLNRLKELHPSFCGKGYYGLRPHEAVLKRGVRVTGATVHFVDKGTDTGPIILQKAVYVQEGDTPEKLQRRVMEQAEWIILPEAIRLISEGRVHVTESRVHIDDYTYGTL